jgi:hypothetical protein
VSLALGSGAQEAGSVLTSRSVGVVPNSPESCTLKMSDIEFPKELGRFGTILADPPWLFANRTGKMAPEHKRLFRYRR